MTLIELLLVIVLIAVASTGVAMGFNSLTRAQLRSASLQVIAASRFAYNRAIVQGKPMRILFDLDKHTLAIEEADGPVLLKRAEDKEETVRDPWQQALARVNTTMKPQKAVEPFHPIRGESGNPIEKYKAHSLGSSVRISKLYLPHESGVRTQGKGSLYFFPGGRTEHAVIELSDDGKTKFSIEIFPLNARGKVRAEAYEPPDLSEHGRKAWSELEDTQ